VRDILATTALAAVAPAAHYPVWQFNMRRIEAREKKLNKYMI
jgi:hypothetical protein